MTHRHEYIDNTAFIIHPNVMGRGDVCSLPIS